MVLVMKNLRTKKSLLNLVLEASIFQDKIEDCSESMESIVNDIKSKAKSAKPEKKFNVMNNYLKSEFTPDSDDFEVVEIVQKGSGSCMGLSTIYKIVGDELNLPLKIVLIKDGNMKHAYILYNDGKRKIPVDTQGATDKDQFSDEDEEVETVVSVFSEPEKMGFKVLDSTFEIFQTYLVNAARSYYLMKNDSKKSIHYYEQIIKNFPDFKTDNLYTLVKLNSRGCKITI